MAEREYFVDLNLGGNQIKNAKMHVVSATSEIGSPAAGMIVYSTGDTKLHVYNGTSWETLSAYVPDGGEGEGDAQFTQALASKLNGIEEGAEVNVIEEVQVDGVKLTVTGKAVNINLSAYALKTTVDGISTKVTALEGIVGTTAELGLQKAVVDNAKTASDNATAIASLKTAVGDATSGLVKDVADLQTGKVDVVEGKGLSTNDYTTAEKTKLAGIADNADVSLVQSVKVNGAALVPDGSKAVDVTVPTKVSDLTNDTGFITKAVADLTNYYVKTDLYTKTEVDALHAAISQFKIQVVSSLPATGAASTIYFVPQNQGVNNVHDEYIWVENKWEQIGSTAFSLNIVQTDGITINGTALNRASASVSGILSSTDWATFNSKQDALTADVDYVAKSTYDTKMSGLDTSISGLTDGKVDKLSSKPTAGTYSKVTITAEGLVSGGETLTAADIPALTAAKITDFAAEAKAATRFQQDVNVTTAGTTVTHNLGCYPSAVAVYKAGKLVYIDVEYIDANSVRLTANADFAATVVIGA